jgi:hypothetical protein
MIYEHEFEKKRSKRISSPKFNHVSEMKDYKQKHLQNFLSLSNIYVSSKDEDEI